MIKGKIAKLYVVSRYVKDIERLMKIILFDLINGLFG